MRNVKCSDCEEYRNEWCEKVVDSPYPDMPRDCQYFHEKIATFGKWIPVSERLPDTEDMMLVTAQPKKAPANVNRAYYMSGSWHGAGSMSNVTAWMPLPPAYQGEQDDH